MQCPYCNSKNTSHGKCAVKYKDTLPPEEFMCWYCNECGRLFNKEISEEKHSDTSTYIINEDKPIHVSMGKQVGSVFEAFPDMSFDIPISVGHYDSTGDKQCKE